MKLTNSSQLGLSSRRFIRSNGMPANPHGSIIANVGASLRALPASSSRMAVRVGANSPRFTSILKLLGHSSAWTSFDRLICAILSHLDQEKRQFLREPRLVCLCRFERDDGRSRLAALVASRPREAIQKRDSGIPAHDREPCSEIGAEDRVLRGSVREDRPDHWFRRSHVPY